MPDARAIPIAAPLAPTTAPATATDAASGHAPGGTLRLLPLAALPAADLAAWQALGAQRDVANNANIFAQPWVVLAGLRHCAPPEVQLALVSNITGQLIGVAPLVRAGRLGRFPLRHWQIWNHPNSFCAPVLVDSGHQQLFWDVLITQLGATPGSGCALAIAEQPLEHAGFAALRQSAAERRVTLSIVEQHARAQALGDEPLDQYWDRHVRAKKRKELRRQAARLAELGAVTVAELAAADDAAPWIDEFLALEQCGWKGSAGSALAAAPGTAAYFREVVSAAHMRGCLSLLALRLDGRAIAMLVTLFDGDAAFSFKTTYDESLARFSPGVQIQRDNLAILAQRAVRWADSCAAADHPMIDSIWAQRRAIGTAVIGLPGLRHRLPFAAYRAALTSWRAVKRLRPSSGNHP
jgi:CelD/BcsL family acetyltransferase involved in cellulose biosynthesis